MNKIIKKGLILSCALIPMAITSCNDELQEVIYSELTTENAFTTESDAQVAINGMYGSLIGVTNRAIFYLNDMPTDACYRKEMPTELLNEAQMSSQQDVNNSWRGYYNIVSRSNIAIDRITPMEGTVFDDNTETGEGIKNKLLGEAYFMRGFAYYQLTDLYYTVPLVTSSSTATDAILPPASIDELEAQIDKDLLQAKSVLPKSFSSKSDAGRATYGAAAGILCRLHMRKAGRLRLAGKDASSEWQLALGYANEILDLEKEGVYSLQKNVWDIFDPTRDEAKYNNELIFTVRSNPNSGGGTSDIGMNFTPWSYDCGWDLFSVPLQLTWMFDKADERYSKLLVTAYPDVYNQAGKRTVLYQIPASVEKVNTVYNENKGATDSSNDDVITNEMGASYTQKYMYEHPLTYNYMTGNNMPLLRLADIILCKAEILNELNGPSQEEFDLINRIRERAFHNSEHNYSLANYSTKDAVRNLLCDERLLELNNEGVRRPDLIRMGLWKDRLDKYVAFIKLMSEWKEKNAKSTTDASSDWKVYPSDLTDNDIRRYFPVPKRESDLNPDLENCRNF